MVICPGCKDKNTYRVVRVSVYSVFQLSAQNSELRTRRSGGFTLLEVLVSLSILGIAVTVIFQLFAAGTRNLALSGDYVSAIVRGEARMAEVLESEPLTEGAWSELTNEGYIVDILISNASQPGTGELPVKLLRIDLTIHWKSGARQKSMTLRTMKLVGKKV